MNKQLTNILIVIIAIVLLNMQIETGKNMNNEITSNVMKEPKIVHEEQVITFEKSELTSCCEFTNENGEQKTCFAIKSFSCDYCNSVC